jgi:hypothetical protein
VSRRQTQQQRRRYASDSSVEPSSSGGPPRPDHEARSSGQEHGADPHAHDHAQYEQVNEHFGVRMDEDKTWFLFFNINKRSFFFPPSGFFTLDSIRLFFSFFNFLLHESR